MRGISRIFRKLSEGIFFPPSVLACTKVLLKFSYREGNEKKEREEGIIISYFTIHFGFIYVALTFKKVITLISLELFY